MEKREIGIESMELERRTFLKGCGAVLGLLALTGATPAPDEKPQWTSVGAEADFTAGEPKFLPEQNAFIVRTSEGVRALSARCTHQGCTVDWSAPQFICPCHQARFSIEGAVVHGPAAKPLPARPAKIEDGQVWIGA